MPQLGPFEFILILVIFMIFFGAGKLGDLGGAVGRGIKEFKKHAGFDESDKTDTAGGQTPSKSG
jgi:sec-independent protein translocase protein TatA